MVHKLHLKKILFTNNKDIKTKKGQKSPFPKGTS